VASSCFVWLGR